MKITLNGAGKKYYREWIFRNANLSFTPGENTVILGPNGSGKSTLLQVIAGAVLPNEGSISYRINDQEIATEEVYNYVSFASPYLELIEEFTLTEIIDFHFKFKKTINGISKNDIIEKTGLKEKAHLVYKYYSSGMKQRVKLALAFFSATPLLLLDEPCSNLDSSGIKWYQEIAKEYSSDRVIIVASNQNKEEYVFCERELIMSEIK